MFYGKNSELETIQKFQKEITMLEIDLNEISPWMTQKDILSNMPKLEVLTIKFSKTDLLDKIKWTVTLLDNSH